jgi:acetyl esterase/lipase
VKAALRWIRGNASLLGIDGARVVAWGESAGGHLAMLAGMTGDDSSMAGDVGTFLDQSSAVCGVIDWYGTMNLLSIGAQHVPGSDKDPDATGSWESSMVGAPLQSDPQRTSAASPITYVHAGAPPVQIHHGTADSLVPFAQSVEFADALRAAGGDVELIPVEGSNHFWTGAPDIRAIFDTSLAFARRVTTT